ncbi:MAG: transposase [Syntrophotaleaceae bacterium]
MPRQPRLDIPGLVFHIMGRGIEGRNIFQDDKDREGFLKRLADEVSKPGGPHLYAWALLPNHFHLLIRNGEGLLSPMMRRLMTGHAVSYNLRHKRQGHLFQNRYKSIVVEEEPYFLELVRYIHLNPVRAGILQNMEELARYRYTGHSVLVGQRKFQAQEEDAVLGRFADRRNVALNGYLDYLAAGISQGRREELRGGGLARSLGGERLSNSEERELSDERILGGGHFVEEVLNLDDKGDEERKASVEDILRAVAIKSGVNSEQILGTSRNRVISRARRRFYLMASRKVGVTITMLARLTGRSHVAVKLAIEQAELEEEEQKI